ncbi:TPA: HNH endonuclease [Photobacterium damselae]
MWSLRLPDNENKIEIIRMALTYANGTPKYALSESEYKIIESIYDRYEELNGRVHADFLAPTLSESTKSALHDGYGEVQERKRLENYRANLLLSAERCPCCSISTADELDHHLPRSIYKSLALYSSNLVPMCHTCNNKKRIAAGTEPSNSFLHVYYDQVPSEHRFFFASVQIAENKLRVSFEVENIEELNDDLYEMIKFQSNRINLNGRLLKEVNIFLTAFYVSMEPLYSVTSDPELIKTLLLKAEKQYNQKMGINDWRSSLLNALANNFDFCNGGFRNIVGIESVN